MHAAPICTLIGLQLTSQAVCTVKWNTIEKVRKNKSEKICQLWNLFDERKVHKPNSSYSAYISTQKLIFPPWPRPDWTAVACSLSCVCPGRSTCLDLPSVCSSVRLSVCPARSHNSKKDAENQKWRGRSPGQWADVIILVWCICVAETIVPLAVYICSYDELLAWHDSSERCRVRFRQCARCTCKRFVRWN